MKLHKQIIESIEQVTDAAGLYHHLQKAIELEHSTIPPYLTALFSLKPDTNREIAQLLHKIVVQEMLHMTIVCNILNAIGGHPKIASPHFMPDYPGHLPMRIGGPDFIVGIEGFSKALVRNTFMVIEEPENPIPPSRLMVAPEDEYRTIGEFYAALKAKIRELPESIFGIGGTKNQVLTWLRPDQLFAITSADTACAGIDIIIDQGEGSSTSPFEGANSSHDPAHYYKFAEIVEGRRITPHPAPYAFNGPEIPFDQTGVYPIKANCKIADFPLGSQARTRIDQFAYTYSSLLNALDKTFNGSPGNIDTAIGLMYSMKMEAVALMQTPVPGEPGLTVGPSYVYTNVQGGMD